MKNNKDTHNWQKDYHISGREMKYICSKCGCSGYTYSYELEKKTTPEFCIKNGFLSSVWLTCDEYIIKSIIE